MTDDNWLTSFHRLAKRNDTFIREMGIRPDHAMTAICDLHQIVMGMVRTGPDEEDVQLLPIKGTAMLRKLATHGERPALGTYERITAIYVQDADEANMLAQVFGDGGIEGALDPDFKDMARAHIAAAEAKRAAKNARRAAAARASQRVH